ncbi:Oxalate decarboxylase OxdD [archaeon HR06]|nr:Oxalate decarboxylase OxdD [archaeon HR06]
MEVKVFDLKDIKVQTILGGPIKPVISNGEGGSKNQVVALGIFKPGEGLYPHFHPQSEEIYFVIKGEGTVFLGEERKPMKIKEGQVIYIPAKTPHCVTNTSKKELQIAFFLSPGLKDAGYSIANDINTLEEKIVKP